MFPKQLLRSHLAPPKELSRHLHSIQLNLISLLALTWQFSNTIYKNWVLSINSSLELSGFQVLQFILKATTLYWVLTIKRLFGLIWIWMVIHLTKLWSIMTKLFVMFNFHWSTRCLLVLVMMAQSIFSTEWYTTILCKMLLLSLLKYFKLTNKVKSADLVLWGVFGIQTNLGYLQLVQTAK